MIGKYTWADGDEYEGEFEDGRRYGYGVLRLKNGQVIRQYWQEDQFEEDSKGLDLLSNEIILPAIKKRKFLDNEAICEAPSNPNFFNRLLLLLRTSLFVIVWVFWFRFVFVLFRLRFDFVWAGDLPQVAIADVGCFVPFQNKITNCELIFSETAFQIPDAP